MQEIVPPELGTSATTVYEDENITVRAISVIPQSSSLPDTSPQTAPEPGSSSLKRKRSAELVETPGATPPSKRPPAPLAMASTLR